MAPLRVMHLRHVPGNPSMTRFADGLAGALSNGDRMTVEQFAPKFRHRAGSRHQLTRLIRYPLAARRLRADVFHLLDHGLGHLTAVLPRERTVVTCHDLAPLRAARSDPRFRPGAATLARYRLVRRLLPRVSRVVCPSSATRAEVAALTEVDPDRIETVHPGLSPVFRPLPDAERVRTRRRLGVGERPLLIHVCSTRYPYKNVPGVLRVLGALRDAGIDARLVRVGRALNRSERRLAGRLEVAEALHEAGAVGDGTLTRLYGAADVLIFPSYDEGFGWPPLEAMACGTPVVASDCAALRETLGEAAITAPPDDPQALARGVAAIISSEGLMQRQRERGFERAAAYSWARAAAGYEAVYRQVAAREA